MGKAKLNFKVKNFNNLSEAQWTIIQKFVDSRRKIKKDLREVVNCILKVTRTDTQWRNIDEKYGAWESIYYYFRKWTKNGIWHEILKELVAKSGLGKEKTQNQLLELLTAKVLKNRTLSN